MRSGALAPSVQRRTCGPVAMAGFCGIALRGSGTSTATMFLPSAVQSTDATSVANNGVLVICTDFPVAMSATKRCDAVSKLPMNATFLLSGDQAGPVMVAPLGASIITVLPVRASINWSALAPRAVIARARLALGSTCSPPR